MKKKKILIDANPVVANFLPNQHLTGIGRTTMELIMAMSRIEDLPVDIALYSQNMKGIGGRNLNTRFRTYHSYIRNTKFFNKLSAILGLRELMSHYDLMHITHNFEYVSNPEKCIVTLHDAFFMKINEVRFNHMAMRVNVPNFAKRCRHIITCSEYSKKDIIETMGISPEKITVIPWGIDHSIFYPVKDKNTSKKYLSTTFGLKNSYFLSVSCNAERKRTDCLLKAFVEYATKHKSFEHDIVLVWANPPKELIDYIQSYGENICKRVHFLKNLSNDDLRKLYNCAVASFTPSSYEGFGLPLLEAMACGCPVFTSNNSSLPEVGGDAVFYLDEPIEESISHVYSMIEYDDIDLADLSRSGIARASEFTWEKAARATIKVYEECLD